MNRGTHVLKAIPGKFRAFPDFMSQMPNLMDVYYMATVTHLARVGGTAKAKLYGMDGNYSIRIQREG